MEDWWEGWMGGWVVDWTDGSRLQCAPPGLPSGTRIRPSPGRLADDTEHQQIRGFAVSMFALSSHGFKLHTTFNSAISDSSRITLCLFNIATCILKVRSVLLVPAWKIANICSPRASSSYRAHFRRCFLASASLHTSRFVYAGQTNNCAMCRTSLN